MSDTARRIDELLASVGVVDDGRDDLDLSSLQVVSLVCAIEDSFTIVIGARDVTRANFRSREALARMVDGKARP